QTMFRYAISSNYCVIRILFRPPYTATHTSARQYCGCAGNSHRSWRRSCAKRKGHRIEYGNRHCAYGVVGRKRRFRSHQLASWHLYLRFNNANLTLNGLNAATKLGIVCNSTDCANAPFGGGQWGMPGINFANGYPVAG